MPMLTPAQVHIDQPLTNLTVAYLQSTTGFIADKVFQNVPVSKQTDKYYIYDRAEYNRNPGLKKLAPRTRPETSGMTLSQDSYSIAVYAEAANFDFQTLANEDTMLQVRQAEAERLTMKMLIGREKMWADNYFSAGIWATEYEGVAGAPSAGQVRQWDDYTNSTPLIDVTNAKRTAQLASGGFRPNVMVVTRDVRDVLVHHPDILSRLSGGATVSDTALVTDAKLAEIFEVSEFLISDAIENTGAAGLAEVNAFINAKKVALYYRPPAPGLRVPAAGYNFTWSTLDNSSGYGVEIRSYTGEYLAIEGIAEEIHSVMAFDMKVVGNEMGVYFDTIIG